MFGRRVLIAAAGLACAAANQPMTLEDQQSLLQVYSDLAQKAAARQAPGAYALGETATGQMIDLTSAGKPGAPQVKAAGMPLNSAGDGGSPPVKIILVAIALVAPIFFFLATSYLDAVRKAKGQQPLLRQGSGEMDEPAPMPSTDSIDRRKSFRPVESEEEKNEFSMAMLFAMPEDSGHVRNFLSGVVISMGCLPEAVSFSLIVGVSPLNGIWAGVFMGLYASLLGGRPGMISCSSAATAIVLEHLRRAHGMGAMALCVCICGGLEVVAGILYLSRFVALVPHPVMLGFANGIAIVQSRAQLGQFKIAETGEYVDETTMWGMILTVVVCMIAATAFPRIPVIGKALPGPLAGIMCSVVFGVIIHPIFPTRTLIDVAGEATFAGGMASIPNWNFPPQGVDWADGQMWAHVFVTAIRMALIGLIESMLTVKLIDQITGTSGSTRRECFGQGLGNIVAGAFGTQGGCALIGQSLLNIGSGGHGRLSGFTMAAGLAMSVLLLAPVMGHVPVAALVGLMFLVALNTFAWGSLGLLHIIDAIDLIVILTVTIVTVMMDLASAVICGLFISALGFAWSAARDVRVDEDTDGEDTRTFTLRGPLFFGSAMNYQNLIRPERIPEKNVVLDFSYGKVLDHSALDAISSTVERLREAEKKWKLTALSGEALRYLESTGTQAMDTTFEERPDGKLKDK